jgi:hypothetical protein
MYPQIVFTATQDVLNVVDNSPAAAVITPLLNEAMCAPTFRLLYLTYMSSIPAAP